MQNSLLRNVVLTSCAVSAAIAGCTSIASKVDGSGEDGVVYYMPLRPIKITVSVDKDSKQTPSVNAGDPFPDLRHRFVLSYDQNYVGKNHMNISVSTKGLLTTSTAETTSGVTTIAKNFAQLAGEIHALGFAFRRPHKIAKQVRHTRFCSFRNPF
jgi:hypothetical protein